MSGREDKLAVLVYEATVCRQRIAHTKDTLTTRLWEEQPRKHQELYDKYEPMIKKDSYRLVELERQINSLAAASPPQDNKDTNGEKGTHND